jgi:signal transduction histidine kinase
MSEAVATPHATARADLARDPTTVRRTALVAALVCAGYYLTAKIGFAFALQPGSVSILWMPNSILLAALLLIPRRFWWIVILCAFPAHLAAELQSGVPTAMVLSWFVSNSLQAIVGALIICRLIDGQLRFDSFKHLSVFLLFGAFFAPFLSSFLDTAFVKLNGWGANSYWDIWRVRFLSNVLATLTLVPVIVTWANGGIVAARKAPLRRWVEAAILVGGLFMVGSAAFSSQTLVSARTPSILYWPLPFLLWATVRFGPRGVSTCLLLVMFLAIYGATHGHGPFVANSALNNAFSIQWFLIVISIPLMFLATAVTERTKVERELIESNTRSQAILLGVPDLVFFHTRDGVFLDYHARDPRALFIPPEEFLGKNIRDVLPAALAERIMECLDRLDGTDEIQVLEYSLSLGDEERHFEARFVGAKGENVVSIVRDITESRRAAVALRRSEEKLLYSNRKIRELAARLITAQESERRRISLLLHDDVNQNIAALGVNISRLKRKLPDSCAQVEDELDRLGKHINDLTTQIRQLSHQLHPDVLEHVGLVAALESHVAEFGHEEQIQANFSADVRKEPIPLDVSDSIYRVALEALRNISRHSSAKSATVSLLEAGGFLTLEVSDSGHGFDVERARAGSGIGLVSAEERVKLLQGTFEIKSNPSVGTTLVARVPLAR